MTRTAEQGKARQNAPSLVACGVLFDNSLISRAAMLEEAGTKHLRQWVGRSQSASKAMLLLTNKFPRDANSREDYGYIPKGINVDLGPEVMYTTNKLIYFCETMSYSEHLSNRRPKSDITSPHTATQNTR